MKTQFKYLHTPYQMAKRWIEKEGIQSFANFIYYGSAIHHDYKLPDEVVSLLKSEAELYRSLHGHYPSGLWPWGIGDPPTIEEVSSKQDDNDEPVSAQLAMWD